MKRIIPLTLAAVLALGTPVAMAQTAVMENQISVITGSLSADNVKSAYTELSKMVNATTDQALLVLLAQALAQVAQVAQDAGLTEVSIAAAANSAAAQEKSTGSAVGEVPTDVGGQDGSPA